MTEERKAWIPAIPVVDKSNSRRKYEESLQAGYASIQRSREQTKEIRKEYRAKALAAG